MAVQDITTLKSYFQTGDQPTQAQFGDVFDTMFALYQEAIDTAEAADDAVAAFIAGGVLAKAFVNSSVAAPPVVADSFNVDTVTSISTGGGLRTVRITFDTPFADTNYTFIATAYDGSGDSGVVSMITKNVAYLEINVATPGRIYVSFFAS
ncbi:MAG TPA: hypothetical protein VK530_13645 [Candidatus Acidoferrum sp.]|nr:hypothetical protein [Candidatus Acidoferrum sp.]